MKNEVFSQSDGWQLHEVAINQDQAITNITKTLN